MTPDVPLYERDPEAWAAHLAEGNARQARKRVSADFIIRDRDGRVLIVEPKYKPGWDVPGGMAEANEAPHEAARRELIEELGLDVPVGRLLCVDWVSPHGPWDDLLAFIFDGGVVDDETVRRLCPTDNEIGAVEFCEPPEARRRLRPHVAARLTAALTAMDGPAPVYLVDGLGTAPH